MWGGDSKSLWRRQVHLVFIPKGIVHELVNNTHHRRTLLLRNYYKALCKAVNRLPVMMARKNLTQKPQYEFFYIPNFSYFECSHQMQNKVCHMYIIPTPAFLLGYLWKTKYFSNVSISTGKVCCKTKVYLSLNV